MTRVKLYTAGAILAAAVGALGYGALIKMLDELARQRIEKAEIRAEYQKQVTRKIVLYSPIALVVAYGCFQIKKYIVGKF